MKIIHNESKCAVNNTCFLYLCFFHKFDFEKVKDNLIDIGYQFLETDKDSIENNIAGLFHEQTYFDEYDDYIDFPLSKGL